MSLLISVVICTYNRATLLSGALQSVCQQTLDLCEYEVIVVDNNSTDNTQAVTESFSQRFPNVRYLFEPQQGNSHARNVGCREARGEYIAFIDDDCKVPKQWLRKAKEIIVEQSPAVFGGPFFAFYNTPKPAWFKDSYGSYVPSDQEAGVLQQPEGLPAGNLFIRSDTFERAGGFNTKFGIIGEKRGYGEENALLRQIRVGMPDAFAYYDPELFVYHLVRHEKMSIRWAIHEQFVAGQYGYQIFHQASFQKNMSKIMDLFGPIGTLFPKKVIALLRPVGALLLKIVRQVITLLRLVGTFLCIVFIFTIGALLRDRKKYPYFQNYLYEKILLFVRHLGELYEEYRQLKNSLILW